MDERNMFGKRLKTALKARYIPTKKAASDTGIGYSTMLAYIKGDRNPTMQNVVALCKYLDVSADWLMGLR